MFAPISQRTLAKPQWAPSARLARWKAEGSVIPGRKEYRLQYHVKAWRPQPPKLSITAVNRLIAFGDQKRQHSSASRLDLKAQLSQSGRLTVVTGKSRHCSAQCIGW